MALRQRGLNITTVDMLARAVSSYLSWLHAEGHLSDHLRIKQIPNPPKPIQVFSDAELRRVLTFKPKGRNQHSDVDTVGVDARCGVEAQ